MTITVPAEAVQPGPWKSRHPLPTEPTKMVITRDMAGDWLDNRFRPGPDTHKQRKTHARIKVREMSKVILRSKFPVTHQGIAFDVNGWLQDGWHRLSALRLASETNPDATIEQWVFPDQDPDNFDSIDVGTPRRAAQLYPGKNGKLITSAVRYLVPGSIGEYQRIMTVADQVRMAQIWTELEQWASAVNGIARRNRIPSAQHLAVLAQATRSEHADRIPDWISGLAEGWNLMAGDVRGHLRNRNWREEGMDVEGIYGILAKSWNYYVTGKTVQTLKFSIAESTPGIIGFQGVPAQILTDFDHLIGLTNPENFE